MDTVGCIPPSYLCFLQKACVFFLLFTTKFQSLLDSLFGKSFGSLKAGFAYGSVYLNEGIDDGSPTRIKNRANAWEKCSKNGDCSRHRRPSLIA
jgi:hypothetical protein